MATILVTGGAGYVGSHACKALAAAGHAPVTYDNLSRGHREAVRWGPLVVGNLADQELLSETLRRYRPSAVLHFAAYAYVGESVENPYRYYRNNVLGTLSLLETMRDEGIQQLVFSSTCATYGNPQTGEDLIIEDHPQAPINPYGASKLMVERMLADAGAARWHSDDGRQVHHRHPAAEQLGRTAAAWAGVDPCRAYSARAPGQGRTAGRGHALRRGRQTPAARAGCAINGRPRFVLELSRFHAGESPAAMDVFFLPPSMCLCVVHSGDRAQK